MKGLKIFNTFLFYLAFGYTIFLFAFQPLVHTTHIFSQKYYDNVADEENPFDFLEDFEIDDTEGKEREEKSESKSEESFEKEFRLKEFCPNDFLALQNICLHIETTLKQIHTDHFKQQHIPEILVPPPKKS